MNRYTIGLGVVLIIAAVGYSLYKKHPEDQANSSLANNQTAREIRPSQSDNTSLETIRELHQEIAALKTRVTQMENLAKTPVQDVTQEKTEKAIDFPSQEQMVQMEHAYFESVGFRFRDQPVDAKWSDEATERITSAAYSGTNKGLTIDRIECRSSMCRLEVPEKNPAVIQAIQSDFRARLADLFKAGVASVDESGKLIVYLATTSKEFPREERITRR